MGVVGNLISGLLDIYENTRGEKKETKKRDYTENPEYKFTGSKKDDLPKVDKTPTIKSKSEKSKKNESKEEKTHEER